MYEKFFGFQEKPFNLVPDPNFLYLSNRHEKALTFLEYGLSERVGFIMLTGEIGIGKTTLIRHLLNQVDEDTDVAVIFNTNVDAITLLRQILSEFEIPSDTIKEKSALLDLLYNFLIQKYAQNRKVFLIIDEAQNLSNDALEEIRMLSNLQTDKELLLQIIIAGQPDLKNRIRSKSLEQFAQRISASFHLAPMTREETNAYITHRLETVGGDISLFAPNLPDKLYDVSGGIPRTINLLCDALLVYGYADRTSVITTHILEQVLQDKEGMGVLTRKDIETNDTENQLNVPSPLENRIQELEEKVLQLTELLETRLEESESRAGFRRDEVVSKLTKLYKSEKEKNTILSIRYGKLTEKYNTLMKKNKFDTEKPILLKEIVK